ncbi:MAG: hypothetical protein HOC71_09430, partial [Candidatus Latescibacteria bacterium]|nr:hypothetical protein [Candidatus Latescibacterota bacterium]
FSGTEFALDGVWGMAKTSHSYLILHPGLVLVEYNGHPAAKKLLLEIADGLLAQRKKDENGNYYIPLRILFPSGDGEGRSSFGSAYHLLWACWRWTGERKYIDPILDSGYGIIGSLNANLIDMLGKRKSWGTDIASRITPQSGSDLYRHIAWQVTGNKHFLEECYADQIQTHSQRMNMYTEGHWWTDRVHSYSRELQRARLGGIALARSALYPGHHVSWKFKAPFSEESVAILIPDATTKQMSIIAFNLETKAVTAVMTGWDIEPGKWEVVQGIDNDGDDAADTIINKQTVDFERTGELEFTFPPKKTTIIKLKLKRKAKQYWKRPDLGIGDDDVTVRGNSVIVTVHSLGSVDAPKSTLALIDASGKTVASGAIPSLNAPSDYKPKTVEIILNAPTGTRLLGYSVTVNPDGKLNEITRRNNTVIIP